MQSDGNSFCGDIVLDIVNMTFIYDGLDLDQNYEKANIFGSWL